MLTPRSTLIRRIAAALDASPSRIPVLVGGCGSGRTTVLQQLRDRIGRTTAQYIDVERTATTPERFLRAVTGSSPFPAIDGGAPASPRAAFDQALGFLARDPCRRGGPRDLPPRRVPRAAHVREFSRPPPRAARSGRRPGHQRQPVRPDQPLHRARAPAAARPLGAVRGHSHPAGHRRRHARHPRAARRTPRPTRSSSAGRCTRWPTDVRPISAPSPTSCT